MKKITLSIVAGLLIFSATAQTASHSTESPKLTDLTAGEIKTVDLSGKYVGKRHQYNPDRQSFMQSFEYEFELKQTGDIITGVSTIIKANGDYADIKLRGMVVGDKLYFEEYEIVNQAKDPSMVWCFKSGSLSIKKDAERLKLVGATNSYMADYYIPCTGGVTDLTKVDNSNNFTPAEGGNSYKELLTADNTVTVFPNPFVESTKISYTLAADSKVTTEVFDITGRKVATLESEAAKSAGNYSVDFNAKNYGYAAGVLIAKVTINGKIYSSEMVQMR